MIADRAQLARNMSAPPRTQLTFSAVRGEGQAEPGCGMHFVGRVDLHNLIPKKYLESTDRETRIRAAFLRAKAELAGRKRPSRAEAGAMQDGVVEDIFEQLADLVRAIPIADLPTMGFFVAKRGNQDRRSITSLLLALAILSRRRGNVFLRSAEPVLWNAFDDPSIDLWAPGDGA